MPEKFAAPGPDLEVVDRARKCFAITEEAESELRLRMERDQKFRASEQWPEGVRQQRALDNRPTLTVNRLPQFLRQVTNFQRRSRPGMKAAPAGGEANLSTALTIQDVFRQIERRSNADIVYEAACSNQADIGRGWIRAHVDYVSDRSFDREILLKVVDNPFTVYPDPRPSYLEFGHDRFMFVTEIYPLEQYKLDYPDSSMASIGSTKGLGNDPNWVTERGIRVGEFWWVEITEDELREYGSEHAASTVTVLASEIEDNPELAKVLAGFAVVRSRSVQRRIVKWAMINGTEILKGNDAKNDGVEWFGQYIPLIPVVGEYINLNGEKDLRGMVRDAMDAQRVYNYWVSSAAEAIALAPKAPYVGAKEQFEGHPEWNHANVRNYPFLPYNAISEGGQFLPPPFRNVQEAPVQAIMAATLQADSDLKSITGFHEPSIGERSHERSAKAIQLLQERSERGSSHFLDHLAASIRHTALVCLDMIPKVYEPGQILRISDELGKDRAVMVAQPGQGGANADKPAGIDELFDPTLGVYEAAVDMGPSFQTRRDQIVEQLTLWIQAYPQSFPILGDVLARHMNHPMAREVADRMYASLPPHLRQKLPDNIPPEARGVVMALQGENTQLKQTLQLKEQDEKAKRYQVDATATMKLLDQQSKERIAILNNRTKLLVEQMKAAGVEDSNAAMQEMELLKLFFNAILQDDKQQLEHLDRQLDRDSAERQNQQQQPQSGAAS